MKRVLMFVFPIVMVFGLIVSAFVIVFALQAAPTASNQVTPTEQLAMTQAVAPVAYGKELFIAKGCIVCHRNDRATTDESGRLGFSEIPNLTKVKVDRDYLRRWLHDPAAMKPSTEMPNLNLSDHEIDALAAFLTAGQE